MLYSYKRVYVYSVGAKLYFVHLDVIFLFLFFIFYLFFENQDCTYARSRLTYT
ncbi:hypothetical protein Hanom_Chr05g00449631 [Helianthus anomalus]